MSRSSVGLPNDWARYLLELALTITAMLALGVLIASLVASNRIADACGAIVFFPTMFFAGLWVPRESMGTVTHLLHLYEKLGVNDRAAAYERGLLPVRAR